MKNSKLSLSLMLAAGAAGVALFKLASASFTSAVPGVEVLSGFAAAAVLGIAAYDYTRRPQRLSPPAQILRPKLRTQEPAAAATARPANRPDRLAA